MDATAGPSSIRFGFTDQRLPVHGGLIVGPYFLRQVGFRMAYEGTPASLKDQPHRLSSQRYRLGISGRCGLRRQHTFQGAWMASDPACGRGPRHRGGSQPIEPQSFLRRLDPTHRHRSGVSAFLGPGSTALPENAKPMAKPRLSPEDLSGRDRSPSGPAPQTRRFRRKIALPPELPGECSAGTVPLDQSCWLRLFP